MQVTCVLTEHPPAMTREVERRYELLGRRLTAASNGRVHAIPYPDVVELDRADAVVLSGSFAAWNVHDDVALDGFGEAVRAYAGPVLGICAGMQLQARFAGGRFAPAAVECPVGFGEIDVVDDGDLLRDLAPRVAVYRRHTEEVVDLPPGFSVLARSPECPVEAFADRDRRWWGTQFHPEEYDAQHPAGRLVLERFFELARSF